MFMGDTTAGVVADEKGEEPVAADATVEQDVEMA